MQRISPQEDRELDCRNPQDAPLCREYERQQGIRSGGPQPATGAYQPPAAQAPAQYGTSKPSFDCAKATYPDEHAICSSAELSQLDNVASAGYEYVRRVNGNQLAKSVTLPLLQARRACGSDAACIKAQQLAAIQKFQSLGAPVSGPPVAQSQQLPLGQSLAYNATRSGLSPQQTNQTSAATTFGNSGAIIIGLALVGGLIWFVGFMVRVGRDTRQSKESGCLKAILVTAVIIIAVIVLGKMVPEDKMQDLTEEQKLSVRQTLDEVGKRLAAARVGQADANYWKAAALLGITDTVVGSESNGGMNAKWASVIKWFYPDFMDAWEGYECHVIPRASVDAFMVRNVPRYLAVVREYDEFFRRTSSVGILIQDLITEARSQTGNGTDCHRWLEHPQFGAELPARLSAH